MTTPISAMTAAVLLRLVTDPALQSLMPDGVYFNVAPLNAARFVILELQAGSDTYGFAFTAWVLLRYEVRAVALNTTGTDVDAAAARIDALLNDAVDLPISGAHVMRSQRMVPIVYTNVDPDNTGIRWQHRGGIYEIQVADNTDTGTSARDRALVGS